MGLKDHPGRDTFHYAIKQMSCKYPQWVTFITWYFGDTQ